MTIKDKKAVNTELERLLSLKPDVIERTADKSAEPITLPTRSAVSSEKNSSSISFSFIFFSDTSESKNDTEPKNPYQMVFDLGKFADEQGFEAVWMPERHFHPFGGIYPNPSVLASALAMQTKNIRLRSGSVVLPLHHPAEVVEAWAMVDQLSGGRVDLGFASGWNPNDFILSPDTFENKRDIWQQRIAQVQRLWRGETMTFPNGKGEEVAIEIYPKPLQTDLNIWFTVSKSMESFRYAGAKGYNILTMLQGIDLAELGKRIAVYRSARKENGHDPEAGVVTLMLHTLVGRDRNMVEEAVREPFYNYVKSGLNGHIQQLAPEQRPSEAELDKMVEYSYARYFETGALFGSVDETTQFADKTIEAGVNEIACLMDFGVDSSVVNESLQYLEALKDQMTKSR